MRKIVLLLGAALTISVAQAQLLQPNEAAVVYYAPKNCLVLDFEFTKEIREAGPYAKYAESLLGVKDAIQANETTYTLGKVDIYTRTLVDTTRVRKVVPEQGFPTQLLTLDSHGLLVGYNLPYAEKDRKPHTPSQTRAEVSTPQVAPLTDEQLDVADEEARAKAIAKQIYRIRESRMYLLSGEVEHAPADGRAMKLVLDELKEEETQLLSLFIGRVTTDTERKKVELMPAQEDTEQKILLFSAENGFDVQDSLHTDTIFVSLVAHRQTYREVEEPVVVTKKGKSEKVVAPQVSQIIYNLPGSAEINVSYRHALLGGKTLPIAQFGIDVPLSRELFTGKTLPVIRFSTRTGNLESINQ